MADPEDRPILAGPRITLRSPRDRDKQDRLACGREPEFRRMVGGDPRMCPPLTVEEVEEWHERVCRDSLCWVMELDGRCIGTARLHGLDKASRRARYAIGIFDSSLWGQGYGTEATRLVLRHAFGHLGLHRVDVRALALNHRAIACYEKCGFVREGVERHSALIAGEWQDDVIMSVWAHELEAGGAARDT